MSKFVAYRSQTGGLMRARVVTKHRDGSVTVEPWFWLDNLGRDTGLFQGGFKLRLDQSEVLQVPNCTP